jgi:hypothetical protein
MKHAGTCSSLVFVSQRAMQSFEQDGADRDLTMWFFFTAPFA